MADIKSSDLVAMHLAAAMVLSERLRQVAQEDYSPSHDDEHDTGEMALAAAMYATPPIDRQLGIDVDQVPWQWPWDHKHWKPGERKRELAKAGALILAELERIMRKESDDEVG